MEFNEYFEQVKQHRKLTNEEILEIYQQNDRQAACNQIIERNYQLVCHLVLPYYGRARRYCIDLMDLVQSGNVGLCQATRNFDPAKSRSYLAYVKRYIQSYIELEFFKHTLYSRRDGKRRIKNSQAAGIAIDLNPVVSLNKIVKEDEDGNPVTLEDLIPDNNSSNEQTALELNTTLEILKNTNGQIHHLALRIIQLRYGVGKGDSGREPLSLAQTAKQVGLSKEGVRKIESKALVFLREIMDCG